MSFQKKKWQVIAQIARKVEKMKMASHKKKIKDQFGVCTQKLVLGVNVTRLHRLLMIIVHGQDQKVIVNRQPIRTPNCLYQ